MEGDWKDHQGEKRSEGKREGNRKTGSRVEKDGKIWKGECAVWF